MAKEKTAVYAILHNKCPRCFEGQFWPSSNPFMSVFVNGGNSHKQCSKCNYLFERGPGFWYGAMYVSYGIGVAIFVATWIGTVVLLPEGHSLWLQLGIMGAVILVLAPVNYFYSRLLWLSIAANPKSDEG